jgi:hypothetical protein
MYMPHYMKKQKIFQTRTVHMNEICESCCAEKVLEKSVKQGVTLHQN